MKQFTVRDVPPEIEGRIIKEAEEKGISLNRAIISLLEKAVGTSRSTSKKKVVHGDLDHLFGIWDEDEWAGFQKSLEQQREVEAELWK